VVQSSYPRKGLLGAEIVGCGNPLYVEFGMEIFKRTREGQTLYILSDSDSEDVGRVFIHYSSNRSTEIKAMERR